MMKESYKKILLGVGILAFFLVISYSFVPQVLTGKIVNQSDIAGYAGMAHEMNSWNSAHPDDQTAWTGSMFSGMPTTTIQAPSQGDWTQPLYKLLMTGRRPATWLFVSLLGAFLMMLALGISWPVAIGGAIAVTFCSYNFQIIQVGHNTKMQAIAFMPWAMAALVYTYKSVLKDEKRLKRLLKTIFGASLFGLAIAMQVKANHQQITYYLALMILIYALALLVSLLCSKDGRHSVGRFFIASAFLLVFGFAGIGTNANKLIPIYKYTPYSMRGGSELADPAAGTAASNVKGLDIDYATAWSYGWEELPNMMIPDFNGGSSSGAVNPRRSETYQLLKQAGQKNLKEISKNLPLYWGPQPFTAGPMYMGAVTVFLFILGLCLYRGRDKWWVIVVTLLAVLLALGSHLIGFTKFWYDYVPFYNKFRTVSMALVILQLTLPVLGFLMLDKIVRGGVSRVDLLGKGLIALIVTGGFCLICALFPIGSFTGAVDAGQPDILVEALQADRLSLQRSDSVRSLILIGASFLILLWGLSVPASARETLATQPGAGWSRRSTAAALVCVLVFSDLFVAGKRYLNNDDFVTPRAFNSQFDKRPVDEMILEDPEPSYRVLDLTANVFNDSHASYWHKNIGGYSPAKLQRYQDLIDHYLLSECNSVLGSVRDARTIREAQEALTELPVLSMLNCKYIILGDEVMPLEYPYRFGNAWFVSQPVEAATKQEEIDLLGTIDPRDELVIGADFPEQMLRVAAIGEQRLVALEEGEALPEGSIEMTYYAPNELRYSYSAPSESCAVFSEVYYPEGWHLYLDGEDEIDLFRADWILRAAVLPAGEHTLVMRFAPESYTLSASISRASSIVLLLFFLLCAAGLAFIVWK